MYLENIPPAEVVRCLIVSLRGDVPVSFEAVEMAYLEGVDGLSIMKQLAEVKCARGSVANSIEMLKPLLSEDAEEQGMRFLEELNRHEVDVSFQYIVDLMLQRRDAESATDRAES